jgi:uncharacterized protein (DUF4415 family)
MKKFSYNPNKPPRLTKKQAATLDNAKIDYRDIPALPPAFFSRIDRVPESKQQLTVRLDKDVLHWLKSYGAGYQTRINHILRTVMESLPPNR